MQWSEVKGIYYEGTGCKIGLYDFLTGEIEIDNGKKVTLSCNWRMLKLHGMTPMMEGECCLY